MEIEYTMSLQYVYAMNAFTSSVGAEKARIAGELKDAEAYAVSLAKKLENKDFLARAPSAIVGNERAKLAMQREKVAKLQEQSGRLE